MNTSARETGPTGGRTGERRTYVLIPGAGGVAWYWHRVVPLLQAAGHEAIAVDLPGDDPAAGLPEYARLVEAAIGSQSSQSGQATRQRGAGRHVARRLHRAPGREEGPGQRASSS